jgi:hypothetical protein
MVKDLQMWYNKDYESKWGVYGNSRISPKDWRTWQKINFF